MFVLEYFSKLASHYNYVFFSHRTPGCRVFYNYMQVLVACLLTLYMSSFLQMNFASLEAIFFCFAKEMNFVKSLYTKESSGSCIQQKGCL